MIYLAEILFWFLYFPLVRLLALLLFWNRKIEEREWFEKKNKFEALAHSFREKGLSADLCFEFSSEGEFQQVAPLIDDALKAGKKIELVFFSPSVEKGVLKLAAQHPQQVRYLRYPLLRIFPFIPRRSFSHWVTAKTLIMVRYDLFPEFLLWALKKEHALKIIWVTFKKERSKGKPPGIWKKLFLKNATTVVYAGVPDLETGRALGFPGGVYDFRAEQIARRIKLREKKFREHFPLYPEFFRGLQGSKEQVILGNAWPSDLFLLRDLPQDVPVVIVPHKLSPEILSAFRESLRQLRGDFAEIDEATVSFVPGKTTLINKKGILCELYTDFSHAYVGGGFEGSIHSALEPLVAGARLLACGPAHFRSTEFDVAEALGKITEVNTPEQFAEWVKDAPREGDHGKMLSSFQGYEEYRELVVSC